jgi:DNA repair protein RadC
LLSGEPPAQWECPHCGYVKPSHDDLAPDAFFRPWHVVHGRLAVKAYVESLGDEAHEWLLALYVDAEFQLLAVDNVVRGDVSGADLPFWKLIDRAHALKAAGFILVHNHPSGDPRPSLTDIQVTRRLAHVSRELDVPLLAHLIIARGEMRDVGGW